MKLKNNRFINMTGALLNTNQMERHMEEIAINHTIKNNSDIKTYPVYRLKENFDVIRKTYTMLAGSIKNDISIYPAGEWILDNFYIIEETVKTIMKEMNIKKYRKLPGLENGEYKGFARVYVLASEIIAYTDCKIDEDTIFNVAQAYQKKQPLGMEEIWNLWIFLQIAIIEKIRNLCEKIGSAQVQKYKVMNIIDRLIEKKETKFQNVWPIWEFKQKEMQYNKKMKYPFIEFMSYNLKQYGKRGIPYLNILEEQVNKMGLTVSEVINKEHFDIAIRKSINGKCNNKHEGDTKIKFFRYF